MSSEVKEEKDWQARYDAEDIIRAFKILRDKKKMAAVKKVLKTMLSEKKKEVEDLEDLQKYKYQEDFIN